MLTIEKLLEQPNELYDEHQVAELLGKKRSWLQRHRWAGTGPAFVKIGRSPRYRAQDLLDYIHVRRVETQPQVS